MPAHQQQIAAPASGQKSGGNGIALKPPAASFAGEGEVAQLVTVQGGYNWSTNKRFATNGSTGIAADPAFLPALAGITWNAEGGNATFTNPMAADIVLNRYRPRWTDNNSLMQVPKDCITTAELVSAWLHQQDPAVVGEVKTAPTIAKANGLTTVNPGDILFHTHSANAGDFHGAGVIATDGGDAITMEADASQGAQYASMTPIFDMYAGHAGFRASQLQPATAHHNPANESTYVIKMADPNTRTAVTLWSSINAEIAANHYTQAGAAAATKIKDKIQEQIAALHP
jgi:hypothetical protein